MKPTDIRIGDWFNRDGQYKQVTGVEKLKICFSDAFILCSSDYVFSKAVEPIPITEDILLANSSRTFIGDRYLLGTALVQHMPSGEFVFFWFRDHHNEVAMEIKYVHQLQHLLHDCGNDDVAENFNVEGKE